METLFEPWACGHINAKGCESCPICDQLRQLDAAVNGAYQAGFSDGLVAASATGPGIESV